MGPPPEAVDGAHDYLRIKERLAERTAHLMVCLERSKDDINSEDSDFILKYVSRKIAGEVRAWADDFDEVFTDWINQTISEQAKDAVSNFSNDPDLLQNIMDCLAINDKVEYLQEHPGLMTFLQDCCTKGVEKSNRSDADSSDIQRQFGVNVRHIGIAFFHHHKKEEGATPKKKLEENVLSFFKEWSENRVMEHTEQLMKLASPDFNFSEHIDEHFGKESPKMRYKEDQIRRRLEGLQWKQYVRNPEKTSKFIRKVEGAHIISLRGIGGIGKTAWALELIRQSLDPANFDEIEPYDYYVVLTTKSLTQGEYRTIEPRLNEDNAEEFERLDPRDDKYSIAEYIGGGDNEYTEFLRAVACCHQEFSLLTRSHEHEKLALDVLATSRILVLLDNYEDIEKVESVQDQFHKFLQQYADIKVTEKNSKILITTRIEGEGSRLIDMKYLDEKETGELLVLRIKHLKDTFDLDPEWAVTEFATELARDPSRFSILEDKESAQLAQKAWGHPLIILYFAYKLVSSSPPEYKGSIMKPEDIMDNYKMIRNEFIDRLFSRVDDNIFKDISKWVMQDALESIDENLLLVLAKFVKNGEYLSQKALCSEFQHLFESEILARQALDFIAGLGSASLVRPVLKESGPEKESEQLWEFTDTSLGFLREALEITPEDDDESPTQVNLNDADAISGLIQDLDDLPPFTGGTDEKHKSLIDDFGKIINNPKGIKQRNHKEPGHFIALKKIASDISEVIDDNSRLMQTLQKHSGVLRDIIRDHWFSVLPVQDASKNQIHVSFWQSYLESCIESLHYSPNIHEEYSNFLRSSRKRLASSSSNIPDVVVSTFQHVLFELIEEKELELDNDGLVTWFWLYVVVDDRGAADFKFIDTISSMLMEAITKCTESPSRISMIEKLEDIANLLEDDEEILRLLEKVTDLIAWDDGKRIDDFSVGNMIQFSELIWVYNPEKMNWRYRTKQGKEFIIEMDSKNEPAANFIAQVKKINIYKCELKYIGPVEDKVIDEDMDVRMGNLTVALEKLIPEYPSYLRFQDLGTRMRSELKLNTRPKTWVKQMGFLGLKDVCERLFPEKISIIGESPNIYVSFIPKSGPAKEKPVNPFAMRGHKDPVKEKAKLQADTDPDSDADADTESDTDAPTPSVIDKTYSLPDLWITAIEYMSDEGTINPPTFKEAKTPLGTRLMEKHPANAKMRNSIWMAFNYSVKYDTNDTIPNFTPIEWCDIISDFLLRTTTKETSLKKCFVIVREHFS